MANIAQSLPEFNTYWGDVYAYLSIVANRTRLGVSTANFGTMITINGVWVVVYPQSQDAGQSTVAIDNTMHHTHADAEAILHTVFNDIPESALSDLDRATLKWPEGDTVRSRLNAATHTPVIAAALKGHLEVEITHINSLTTKKAMPEGQKVLLERTVAAAGLAASAVVFTTNILITHSPVKMFFTEDDVAKVAYMRACYVSRRGDKGPYGPVITVPIA